MNVCIFEPWYDPLHQRLLRSLAKGIPGARVCDVRRYEPCDVAVIFGLVKKSYANTQTKAEVIRRHRGPLLVLERGFVRRNEYWSLGWGGINGRADFCNAASPYDRWSALGVNMATWKRQQTQGPVLVCGQVPWDVTVQDTDHNRWCREMVSRVRQAGFEVWFRPHPYAAERGVDYGVRADRLSRAPLTDDLKHARACVTYSSNAGVEAALAGVPVYAGDEGSMALPVAHRELEALLHDTAYPEREQWAAGLAYAQWTEAELASGAAWAHIARSLHHGAP